MRITKATITKARILCANWHGGQTSPFYSFASTGIHETKFLLLYLMECEENLQNEYFANYPRVYTKKEASNLQYLKALFLQIANEKGYTIEYIQHPLYGYKYPAIKERSEQTKKDEILPIQLLK